MTSKIEQQAREQVQENPANYFELLGITGLSFRRMNGKTINQPTKRITAGQLAIIDNGEISGVSGLGKYSQYNGEIFKSLAEHNGTTRQEAIRAVCGAYGLKYELTDQEKRQLHLSELAEYVADTLGECLRRNQNGETAQYLAGRGFTIDTTQKVEDFGELTPEALDKLRRVLADKGLKYDQQDLQDLQITTRNAEDGYKLAIPYKHNGHITGFLLRYIGEGKPSAGKYKASKDLERPGYCRRIDKKKPALIVEGELDAIRLYSLGYTNVVAMGKSKLADNQAKALQVLGVRECIYIPDRDTDPKTGKERKELIAGGIESLESAGLSGRIALLPYTPGNDTDPDTMGKEQPEQLADSIAKAVPFWKFKTRELDRDSLTMTDGQAWEAISKIYDTLQPYQIGQLKEFIAFCPTLNQMGINRESLELLDNREKYQRDQDTARAILNKITKHRPYSEIKPLLERINDERGEDTRTEWREQLERDYTAILTDITNQPQPIETKWGLTFGDGQPADPVHFYPGDIALFVAPTSHGKTMILLQSAIDLAEKEYNGVYLYISAEENQRQLYERALNVYLDIPNLAPGQTDSKGGAGFIRGTRKKALKSILSERCSEDLPTGYQYKNAEQWAELSGRVEEGLKDFEAIIFKHLKLIHTQATAEEICRTVEALAEDLNRTGTPLKGVFLDYLQILSSEQRTYSRTDEIKAICKVLKDTASRLDVPFIIAGQLNREATKNGIDSVSLANIGESVDIERIAHDIYLVWQTDKPAQADKATLEAGALESKKERLARIAGEAIRPGDPLTKANRLYIEQLKGRDNRTGGWALLPYDGESGQIEENELI